MATFTERLRLIFDVDSKGAQTGFGGFAKSVRDADGLFGKARAGAASLVATVKDNMGTALVAGGAALVSFGVKAVGAFTSGAKAALDMAKATGLSTEQASRWIAVGDDMGVSASQLTTGIGKIAKTLDGAQWAKYGIATRDAAGKTRDANDVLLDALDVLAKIPNATDRAAAGNALFGKGYVNLAPLVGKTRVELEKYLGAVEDGQVYTEKETKKAEKMRLAQDQLADAFGELTLAVGGTVAELAPLIEKLADVVGFVPKLTSALGTANDAVEDFTSGSVTLTDAALTLATFGLYPVGKALAGIDWTDPIGGADGLVDGLKRDVLAAQELAGETDPSSGLSRGLSNLSDHLDGVRRRSENLRDEWDALKGKLNQGDQWANVSLQLLGLQRELDNIAEQAARGDITAEEAWIKSAQAIGDAKAEVVTYAEEVAKLPPEQATKVMALIDAGKYAEAQAMLTALGVPVAVPVSASFTGGVGGDRAQELQARGGVVYNVNVYPQKMSPEEIQRGIADWQRRNGKA